MKLYGHRRGGAYPQSPKAGGGSAALVPLARQRFIDGDTTQTGLNGSIADPYATIAQFMTARAADNTSVDNATANFVGWVMPAAAGYTENPAFPPYVSTELRADSFSVLGGTTLFGNVTWANVGPLPAPGATATQAIVSMHNITVAGSITVTDDVNAPPSFFVYGGDEAGDSSVRLLGGFVSNTTQSLNSVTFANAIVGTIIDTGGAETSAAVTIYDCVIGVLDLTCPILVIEDSTVSSEEITTGQYLGADTAALFLNCFFEGSTDLSCGATPTGAVFDAVSWNSFIEGGGTRDAGTSVLVIGGYSGAAVEGAALTGAATSVSLNGTGATAGYTAENSGNHYTTSNGTPTAVTLLTGGGEQAGDTICITKTDLGANAVAVINGGVGAGTIGTIPANERGFVIGRFDGTNWVFEEGGSLAA